MSKRKVYTVAVVGDTRVGKTCLVNKLCYGTIPLEYEPTIEDLHTTILLTEKVEVIDTSADSAATVLRRAAMRSADAVMFVVDIQDITSIHHLPHHLQEYQQVRCSDCPCLVVGLARRRGPVSQEAVERAQQMAELHGLEFTTSTLHRISVRAAFERCVFLIEERRIPAHVPPATQSCCVIL